MELDKELAVWDQRMTALKRLLSALSGDIVSVPHISLGDLNVALVLTRKQPTLNRIMVNKSVEKDREPVVLDLMRVVLQKLLFVQSMATANVLNISLGGQSVVLDLMIKM